MGHQTDSANIELVCDAIVERYHAAVQESLPRVRDALAAIGAATASHELEMLRVTFDDVAGQIERHLAKEEQLLFPIFAALSAADRGGRRSPSTACASVLHSIRLMESEHTRIEMALTGIHELARAVIEADARSPGSHGCLVDLSGLVAILRDDHRVETEILFPKVLEVERRLR